MNDLKGRKFHCLTVVGYDYKVSHWICECSCGKEAYAKTYDLLHDKKKSCGHLRTEHNKMYAEKFLKNKQKMKMPNTIMIGGPSGWSVDDSLDELGGLSW